MTGAKDETPRNTGPRNSARKEDPPEDKACTLDPAGRDLDSLAEAWIALWQGELAALAADPEVAAAWRQAFGLGAAWLHAAQGNATRDNAPHERNTAAPRAAPAGPAPGDGHGDALGDADAARLRARIDALERRLATLERGAAGSVPDRGKPRRRRPPA